MPPKKAQAAKATNKKKQQADVPDRTKAPTSTHGKVEDAPEDKASKDEGPHDEEVTDADKAAKPDAQDEEMTDANDANDANGVENDDDKKVEKDEEGPQKKKKKKGEKENRSRDEGASMGQKRKTPPTDAAKTKSKKEPRQGSRASGRTPGGGSGKDATTKQVLNFLLSKDAIPYCFPEDELKAVASGKFKKNYSMTPPSAFTPFEHLVTAHLLSKPLSHTLGMRSVRTLLNSPYRFTTPDAMQKAGEGRVWEALEAAKTQHRQKTAAYLFQMADEYGGAGTDVGDSDVMLELATEANEGGPRATIAHLKGTVKGLGEMGGQIFCRRVQAVEGWGEAIWPYADPKSIDALRELGVKVADADELQSLIEGEVDWDKVGDMGLVNEKEDVDEKDYEVQVAVELVVVLERAIGCVLEGNASEVRRAAAAWN